MNVYIDCRFYPPNVFCRVMFVRRKVIIMGAAGRDFHNFNVYFRENENFEVVAFTAAQIPRVALRLYPPELAGAVVDPKPYAVGSIKETYALYPHLSSVLPALGYSEDQISDLKATIDATPCDTVLVGTPVDLERILHLSKPTAKVNYELHVLGPISLEKLIYDFLERNVKL